MKATSLIRTNVGNFDKKYRDHSPYNLIVPCLQWSEGDNPARTYDKLTGKLNSEIASFTEKYLPSTYIGYADVMYQYAARYGSSRMEYLYENVRAHSDGGTQIGLNYIKWLEWTIDDITAEGAKVKVLVVCTDEEMMIARDTLAIASAQ